MALAVIMPRQGQSVESCLITGWHKNVGDSVAPGDKLFSYETDKAAFEEEAKAGGVMLAVFFKEGDDVACLTNVCVIGEPGEDFGMFDPKVTATQTPADAPPVFATESLSTEAGTGVSNGCRIKISPRARNLADRSGAILEHAVPTGPEGRIIERDVRALIQQGRLATSAAHDAYVPGIGVSGGGIGGRVTSSDLKNPQNAPALSGEPSETGAAETEYETVKLPNIRKVIANTMRASLADSAQLTLNTSFDASDIIEFRKKRKALEGRPDLPPVSVTDTVIFSVSRALAAHGSLNAHYLEDNTMKVFNDAHIGVAVDTPRGLLVPTLFRASRMSLAEISAEAARLYSMCSQGTINPDLLQGASFSISNLGAMGIESFTPVLNPPQTGILGVCAITERLKNGKAYPAMGLSLTFDHRALDGADAARFLRELVERLENFSLYAALGR